MSTTYAVAAGADGYVAVVHVPLCLDAPGRGLAARSVPQYFDLNGAWDQHRAKHVFDSNGGVGAGYE
jgi:hypothetical protein